MVYRSDRGEKVKGGGGKIRNPKHEIRNKFEISNSKFRVGVSDGGDGGRKTWLEGVSKAEGAERSGVRVLGEGKTDPKAPPNRPLFDPGGEGRNTNRHEGGTRIFTNEEGEVRGVSHRGHREHRGRETNVTLGGGRGRDAPATGEGGSCYPLFKERPCSGLPRERDRTGECMDEAGGASRRKLGFSVGSGEERVNREEASQCGGFGDGDRQLLDVAPEPWAPGKEGSWASRGVGSVARARRAVAMRLRDCGGIRHLLRRRWGM
jgi:hypothetical protein